MTAEEFDPDDRSLCPDGNCTGLLGDDGRCKECGRSANGEPALPALEEGPATEHAAPDEFDSRRLCSDGSCTGLIGEDGRCKECGKSS
jgi:hypothetical protein